MTPVESPTLTPEPLVEQLKAFVRFVRPGGCRVLTIGAGCGCPLCLVDRLADRLRQRTQELTASQARRYEAEDAREVALQRCAELKVLANIGTWHNECRPNRKQAAEEIQKSQQRIDTLAEQVARLTAERDQLQADLAQGRAERDQLQMDLNLSHATNQPLAENRQRFAAVLRAFYLSACNLLGDPEDCDDCADLDTRPCKIHGPASNGFYRAFMDAAEVLGPCVCGHRCSNHEDCDSTHCKKCDCKAFTLPPVVDQRCPAQEP